MKIYYITRTWPENDGANCSNLRVAFAESLKKIAPVVVVTPNYDRDTFIGNGVIRVKYDCSYTVRNRRFQYLGLNEDYLDSWVNETLPELKEQVTEEDVIYSVSGGELACIKLGSLIKKTTRCKFIIDFNDPVDGDVIFGEKIAGYWGRNRVKLIDRYCRDADAILTTSETYQNIIGERVSCPVFNRYIGYLDNPDSFANGEIRNRERINIVYSGTDTIIQNSDVLYEACKELPNVEVTYICKNYAEKKKRMPENNIKCIPLMKREEYLEYMRNNADVGFVSLKGKYSRVFMPSKIYEYINLGIPILGSLPSGGSAYDIISSEGYGLVSEESDIDELRQAVFKMLESPVRTGFTDNILRDRIKWSYLEREKQYLDDIVSVI